MNKACKQLIENFESSTSSSCSNSSDEELDKNKQQSKKSPKKNQKSKKKSSRELSGRRANERNDSPASSREGLETIEDCIGNNENEASKNTTEQQQQPKRPNTIHVANPAEQRRESRRALNLNDDPNQPRPRLRTRSQGRRGSENTPVSS